MTRLYSIKYAKETEKGQHIEKNPRNPCNPHNPRFRQRGIGIMKRYPEYKESDVKRRKRYEFMA